MLLLQILDSKYLKAYGDMTFFLRRQSEEQLDEY